MALSRINVSRILDPIKLQQVLKYRGNLTVTSNDTNIIPRDDAGNISLETNSENNPLLIIEPVATRITLNSILKVIDTRFQYFKFPATTRVVDTPEVDVDLTVPELENIIKTEYTLPVTYDSQNQPNPFLRINTSYDSKWYYNDGVTTSRGYKQLPFTGDNQIKLNGYTLTQNTIDLLRSRNKTLRFTIQTQVAWNADNSITRMRLFRNNPKIWKIFEYPEVNAIATNENAAPVLKLTYVLNVDDISEGDFFTVEAVSGSENALYTENAFWTIEEIDIPETPSLSDNIGYGVYEAEGDELIVINSYDNTQILKINLR